jgi:hypothetical protein
MIVTNTEGIVEISGLSSGGTTAKFNRGSRQVPIRLQGAFAHHLARMAFRLRHGQNYVEQGIPQ